MRLLLDEHFSRDIATGLRARAHDVAAVTEHGGLIGLPDDQLLEFARADRRALVTENVRDFLLLVHDLRARERPHGGVVLVPPSAFPRHRAPVAPYVRSLNKLLVAQKNMRDPTNRVWWLTA